MTRQTLNDDDRAQWVDNDEGLYTWWQSERPRKTKRQFVRDNREYLTEFIQNALNGNDRYARASERLSR